MTIAKVNTKGTQGNSKETLLQETAAQDSDNDDEDEDMYSVKEPTMLNKKQPEQHVQSNQPQQTTKPVVNDTGKKGLRQRSREKTRRK